RRRVVRRLGCLLSELTATGSRSSDRDFMELAIDEMAKSTHARMKVGAVLVKDGALVTAANRTSGMHAERSAIEQAQRVEPDLKASTIYTTLEPCISLDGKRESCADLISRVGISSVVIGRYDPNPAIYRMGWR